MNQFFYNFQMFLKGMLGAIGGFITLVLVLFCAWLIILLVLRLHEFISTQF
jgi:hypothetical protein